MNAPRRAQLKIASRLIEEAKTEFALAVAKLEEANGLLETARDEEEEYADNMPEALQGGEKYSKAEEAVTELETAISTIADKISSLDESELDEVIAQIETASA